MEAIRIDDYNKISEPDIIRRILRGEKELYEILLRRNNQKLFRVVRIYLKDKSEIQDVMQDTYMKAYEKLFQFKFTSSFSTWLIRIGINEALASIKQKNKVFSISESSNHEGNPAWDVPDQSRSNPEKLIMKNEIKEMLENAIDNLEPKYRSVYILKEVEGMSIREVAQTLDITPENVKVRLHRAKSMLKNTLFELSMDADVFTFGSTDCDSLTARVMLSIR